MSRQYTGYWWFGINNKNAEENKSTGHVIYHPNLDDGPDDSEGHRFDEFLNGNDDLFYWPWNKRNHRKWYERMKEGDSVLFWMGDGYFTNWGIIGFGYIDINSIDRNEIILRKSYVPEITIKPYENHDPNPLENENTRFLESAFNIYEFKPLFRTFKKLGKYKKKAIITIESITKLEFDSCLEYAKYLNINQ